jgi:hypothetical protein
VRRPVPSPAAAAVKRVLELKRDAERARRDLIDDPTRPAFVVRYATIRSELMAASALAAALCDELRIRAKGAP